MVVGNRLQIYLEREREIAVAEQTVHGFNVCSTLNTETEKWLVKVMGPTFVGSCFLGILQKKIFDF